MSKSKFILGKIQGVPVINITPIRIKESYQKQGLYYYHIRHCDENWGEPIFIKKNVLVNHYGTIVTTEPIPELESPNFDENWIAENKDLYDFIVSHC